MQRSVLEDNSPADVSVIIVWIDILEGDSREEAERKAAAFGDDVRLCHFHDPKRLAGEAFARGLGARRGEAAWDVYLFYRRGVEWCEAPPVPYDWVHQLGDSTWAPPENYRTGIALMEHLYRSTKESG